MPKHQYRKILSKAVVIALCSLFAACGVTSTTGSGGAIEGTATVVTRMATASPAPRGSPTSAPGAKAAPGAVRLTLDKSSYAPGDAVIVTIENGLSVQIEVSDHHTNCTYLVLEQQLGSWQPIGTCRLMTPTRLVDLAPGSVTPQKLGIPTGPNAAGTYRVLLGFNAAGGDAQGGFAYSTTFTVG